MNKLKECRRLYGLGFAIHWLRPKSKVPLKAGWTSGEREKFNSLKTSYVSKYNMGVRLGKASKVGEGYLAVIDCDVKSTEPKHLKELEDKLKKLFTGDAPIVYSGRGNGSKHIYIRTTKPLVPYRFSQSKEKVKVLMPSSKPSRYELANLSDKEIKKGIRLKAAWEISVMGGGQQVVLPPSIHPDSGKAYTWSNDIEDTECIPIVDLKSGEGESKKKLDDLQDFDAVDVDLYTADLSDKMISLIEEGDGCEDRSASMFSASMAMHGAGLSQKQILSVLTDKENYLGATGYEHAKTNSRKRAAQWVYKYTYLKAKSEADLESNFDEEVDFETLSSSDAKKQLETILDDDWLKKLQRARPQDPPKASYFNIKLIMDNSVDLHPFIGRNEFTAEDMWLQDTPWGAVKGRPVNNDDSILIKDWLVHKFRIEASVSKIEECVIKLSLQNKFHPVRGFLDGLVWDGTPRLNNWLATYLKAVGPKRYLQLVGSKTLIAMVKRIYEPGCKFDSVLILEGPQGVGKSSTARILAHPWFSDSDLNVGDKDAVVSMQGTWVYELGELSAMSRADTNQLKHFLSRAVDKIRPPYGKRLETYPRQCVFIGTTNHDEYLKDRTGNRRYWPVKIGRVDLKTLERDRDQLLAEAIEEYMVGADVWVSNRGDVKLIEAEQGLRVESDDLVSELAEFFNDDDALTLGNSFRLNDLIKVFPAVVGIKNDRLLQLRLGSALRDLGFEKKNKRVLGVQSKVWGRNKW